MNKRMGKQNGKQQIIQVVKKYFHLVLVFPDYYLFLSRVTLLEILCSLFAKYQVSDARDVPWV